MALSSQTSLYRLLIVSAALLGALVVTHLGLQARADFANGCSGLAGAAVTYDPTAPAEVSGCAEVTQGAYATFLGVSNIAWGLLFYAAMVILRLGYAATGRDRVRQASAALSTAGVLYAAYLVYLQAAVIQHYCVLCLTSSALVLTLFVLHLLEQRRLRAATSVRDKAPARTAGGALRPYLPALGIFAVLLVGDMALAARSSAAPGASALPPGAPPTAAGAGQPGTTVLPAATCGYDARIPAIADMAPFTSGPYQGAGPEGGVSVVEIFDPNCPHCRDLAELMEPVIEAERASARFYFVPYPLRPQSVAQVLALTVAQSGGTFFPLMDEMFERQSSVTWGMTLPALVATLDSVGMDGAGFEATLGDEAALKPLLERVQTEADLVTTHFSTRDGDLRVPRVAINGRVMSPTSFTLDCFHELITEAAAL